MVWDDVTTNTSYLERTSNSDRKVVTKLHPRQNYIAKTIVLAILLPYVHVKDDRLESNISYAKNTQAPDFW